MYKYPYITHFKWVISYHNIQLWHLDLWVWIPRHIYSRHIACICRCISDHCFSPPEQYFSGAQSGDQKYICVHWPLNKLLKTTVLIHVFCYNSRSTCKNRDLYLCHYLLIPQWKFLCDIYMNLTDDSEVIISEVNSIKLLRV